MYAEDASSVYATDYPAIRALLMMPYNQRLRAWQNPFAALWNLGRESVPRRRPLDRCHSTPAVRSAAPRTADAKKNSDGRSSSSGSDKNAGGARVVGCRSRSSPPACAAHYIPERVKDPCSCVVWYAAPQKIETPAVQDDAKANPEATAAVVVGEDGIEKPLAALEADEPQAKLSLFKKLQEKVARSVQKLREQPKVLADTMDLLTQASGLWWVDWAEHQYPLDPNDADLAAVERSERRQLQQRRLKEQREPRRRAQPAPPPQENAGENLTGRDANNPPPPPSTDAPPKASCDAAVAQPGDTGSQANATPSPAGSREEIDVETSDTESPADSTPPQREGARTAHAKEETVGAEREGEEGLIAVDVMEGLQGWCGGEGLWWAYADPAGIYYSSVYDANDGGDDTKGRRTGVVAGTAAAPSTERRVKKLIQRKKDNFVVPYEFLEDMIARSDEYYEDLRRSDELCFNEIVEKEIGLDAAQANEARERALMAEVADTELHLLEQRQRAARMNAQRDEQQVMEVATQSYDADETPLHDAAPNQERRMKRYWRRMRNYFKSAAEPAEGQVATDLDGVVSVDKKNEHNNKSTENPKAATADDGEGRQ